jgi:hypothetical protein
VTVKKTNQYFNPYRFVASHHHNATTAQAWFGYLTNLLGLMLTVAPVSTKTVIEESLSKVAGVAHSDCAYGGSKYDRLSMVRVAVMINLSMATASLVGGRFSSMTCRTRVKLVDLGSGMWRSHMRRRRTTPSNRPVAVLTA